MLLELLVLLGSEMLLMYKKLQYPGVTIFVSEQRDYSVTAPLRSSMTFHEILITEFSMKDTYFSNNRNGSECSIAHRLSVPSRFPSRLPGGAPTGLLPPSPAQQRH